MTDPPDRMDPVDDRPTQPLPPAREAAHEDAHRAQGRHRRPENPPVAAPRPNPRPGPRSGGVPRPVPGAGTGTGRRAVPEEAPGAGAGRHSGPRPLPRGGAWPAPGNRTGPHPVAGPGPGSERGGRTGSHRVPETGAGSGQWPTPGIHTGPHLATGPDWGDDLGQDTGSRPFRPGGGTGTRSAPGDHTGPRPATEPNWDNGFEQGTGSRSLPRPGPNTGARPGPGIHTGPHPVTGPDSHPGQHTGSQPFRPENGTGTRPATGSHHVEPDRDGDPRTHNDSGPLLRPGTSTGARSAPGNHTGPPPLTDPHRDSHLGSRSDPGPLPDRDDLGRHSGPRPLPRPGGDTGALPTPGIHTGPHHTTGPDWDGLGPDTGSRPLPRPGTSTGARPTPDRPGSSPGDDPASDAGAGPRSDRRTGSHHIPRTTPDDTSTPRPGVGTEPAPGGGGDPEPNLPAGVGHGHGHGHGPATPVSRQVRVLLAALLAPFALVSIVLMVVLFPTGDAPTSGGAGLTPVDGTITAAEQEGCRGGGDGECLTVTVQMDDGPAAGSDIRTTVPLEPSTPRFAVGDDVVLAYNGGDPLSGQSYQLVDFQRGTPLVLLAAAFAAAVVALGRWQGVKALGALGVGVLVLVAFVLPAIVRGEDPLLVGVAGAGVIMFAVLYLTHGLSARTSTAVLGTMVSLGLIGALSALFSAAAALTGLDEETATLVGALGTGIDTRGLLLAGIVIGALGVLDDVTVTQTSVVWELRAANPALGWRALYAAGLRIGRDHVASAVNTLVMAYAGAALPLLLYSSVSGVGLGDILGSQSIAQELVRTLVGSIGLVAAVPVTTAVAALVAVREPARVSPGSPRTG